MTSDLRWSLLQQNQQSLKYQVGETRPNGDIVQQTLDIIYHHTAELWFICIIKDLKPKKGGKEMNKWWERDMENQEEESVEDGKGQVHRFHKLTLKMFCCFSWELKHSAALAFLIAWHFEISECPIILSGEQILMNGNCESSEIFAAKAVFPLWGGPGGVCQEERRATIYCLHVFVFTYL